jgi:hypothetical protein
MSFNAYYIRSADFFSGAGGHDEAVIITRDNYEEYFVMYIDDELNGAARKAVEEFVQQNPDLEEELVMLQQSVLRPDEKIVFEQKETLLRNTTAQGLINSDNCEEYFVLYGDDELTNEEKDQVEQFVYKHPQYQEDFELIQQVKLVPDNAVTFPDKAYLFRTEEDDNKLVAFPWWHISAAAIALLVLGTFGWYVYLNNHSKAGSEVAVTTVHSSEKNNQSKSTAKNGINPTKTTEANNATGTKAGETIEKKQDEAVVTVDPQPVQQEAVNVHDKNISASRNIQVAQNVTQQNNEPMEKQEEKLIRPRPVEMAVVRSYATPAVNSNIIQKHHTEIIPVATTAVAVMPDDANVNQTGTYVLSSPNKTPLRGFFRKVSRVVDRVTSPDENGKGVRIANLEIALK